MAPNTRAGEARRLARLRRRSDSGFTYIGVLLLVAIAGLVLAAAGTNASMAMKREQEKELLFIGGQFRDAIRSYYRSTPGVAKRFPPNLEVLLHDARSVVPRRHLRKMYIDPVTHSVDWGLVRGPGGAIVGVFSKSQARPLKQARFRAEDQGFDGAATYADWQFVVAPSPALDSNNF